MKYQRLKGLIKKEFIQIVRDPSAIAIAFIMPVVLLFLFGYGVSLDAKNIRLGIITDAPTAETESFSSGLEETKYFNPKPYLQVKFAAQDMVDHKLDGILWFRNNFSRQLLQNEIPLIGAFINGVDANTAHIVQGYLQGVWAIWLQHYANDLGKPFATPLNIQNRIWFNPALRSRDYLVPGLIAVIMTLIGALLTALVVAREWERGTMEALMATPVTISEILIGKLIPYFILGVGGMLFAVAIAVWLFKVPLMGNFWLLLLLSSLFLLTALGMGLLISSIARNQFVASQTAIIVTFLPAFILSGFIFDIHSMPIFTELLTYIVPARYYVSILQTVFLAGDIPFILWLNGLALVIMAIIFIGITFFRSHKRLD